MRVIGRSKRRVRAVRLAALLAIAVACFASGVSAAIARPDFTPRCVLSDANLRDYDSMSAADIQRFLNSKPGPLKRMSFQRHDGGSVAPASVIIWEACQAWHINPKVMLVMLQKEQSLITRKKLAKQTLNRAIGAGCPETGGNRYPGFGNQMWHGARLLDGYGEPGKTTDYVPGPWVYGMANKFTRSMPTSNSATYKLYVYNPSIGAKWPYGDLSRQSCSGNANFWKIWWAYWGDPMSEPAGGLRPASGDASATSVVLDNTFSKVPWGQPASIAGRLAPASSTVSPAGATVRLELLSASGWVPAGEQAVGVDGRFGFALATSETQRARVVFPGTPGLHGSNSGCFVSEAVPTIGIASITSVVKRKRPVRMSGIVSPGHRSTVVVSVYRVKRGKRLIYRRYSVATGPTGSWTFSKRLPKGTWSLRAVHNDAGHAGASSVWATARVR